MHFRAQLVLKVDGKLKQSKKLYDLIVEKDMVCFKDSGSFTRSFPKPDKAIAGKRVLRVHQGSRYFICRFPDRANLVACVAQLREMHVSIVDYFDLTQQDSTKQLQLEFCNQYMASAHFERDTRVVQSCVNRVVFDSSR
ncbi:Aste57867_847 [Aphanomyces stellatus]|uniref:Aste57867_847 protein n=1 Tax=Aphanomyces stellatus TaxID=120398 RepID=A0A485K6X7_9STRA|nr:hypothetical protein As57867_000846 [Aphanomyces stellatus]VFT78071.1 Aste57867_847 [Aphanomyces stellatus]